METNHPEPATLNSGDSWGWTRKGEDCVYYDGTGAEQYGNASDGWALSYVLAGPNGTKITIAATASGEDYLVAVSPTLTAGYTAGVYWWAAYVTKGSARYQVDSGKIEILPNLAAVTAPYDGRSDARIIYDYLISTWKSSAAREAGSYSIGGRSVTWRNPAELLKAIAQWKAMVDAEDAEDRINKGMETGRRILARFGSVGEDHSIEDTTKWL